MLSNDEFKYSQATLSKFDIIGSYFVNLYYNDFYSKAHSLKLNGQLDNTTDAYKHILSTYLDFIKNPDGFKKIIKGIHGFVVLTTKYTTMTHKECIDFIVSEFIPQKLWNSIRDAQKNKLLHDTLNDCIATFTVEIISNYLVMIIDNHAHEENITILQDLFLRIILLEKDKIYAKFLNPDNTNMISIDLFKSKLKDILNDKKELMVVNEQYKKQIEILKQLNEKNSNVIVELQKQHKLNISRVADMKNQLLDYINKNKQLESLIQTLKQAPLIEKVNKVNKVNQVNQEVPVIPKPIIKKIEPQVVEIQKKISNIIPVDSIKLNKKVQKSKNTKKEPKSDYAKLLDSDSEYKSSSSDSDSDNDTQNILLRDIQISKDTKKNTTVDISNKQNEKDKKDTITNNLEFDDNNDYY